MQAETFSRHELPWPRSLLYDFKQRCLKAVEFGERDIRKAIDRSGPEVAFSIFPLFIKKKNDYG